MDLQISVSRRILGIVFFAFTIGLLLPLGATAQPKFVVRPVAEKKLKELPAGPLFWRIENFPTIEQAHAAETPTSLAVQAVGKVWLFTLGPKCSAVTQGSNAVEIGPVPTFTATEYMLRINYAEAPPGTKTPVHTHPGSETFYVLTGELGQKSASRRGARRGRPVDDGTCSRYADGSLQQWSFHSYRPRDVFS